MAPSSPLLVPATAASNRHLLSPLARVMLSHRKDNRAWRAAELGEPLEWRIEDGDRLMRPWTWSWVGSLPQPCCESGLVSCWCGWWWWWRLQRREKRRRGAVQRHRREETSVDGGRKRGQWRQQLVSSPAPWSWSLRWLHWRSSAGTQLGCRWSTHVAEVASTSQGWSWAERRRTCWEEELLLTVLRD